MLFNVLACKFFDEFGETFAVTIGCRGQVYMADFHLRAHANQSQSRPLDGPDSKNRSQSGYLCGAAQFGYCGRLSPGSTQDSLSATQMCAAGLTAAGLSRLTAVISISPGLSACS